MNSIRSTVEHRFESYSGSLFSAMETEYVVFAEQAHPLDPAYPLHTSFYYGVMHVMILCLHAAPSCSLTLLSLDPLRF